MCECGFSLYFSGKAAEYHCGEHDPTLHLILDKKLILNLDSFSIFIEFGSRLLLAPVWETSICY